MTTNLSLMTRQTANRRRLLAGAVLATCSLRITRSLTFAQDATPASGLDAPQHAVIWLKYNLNTASSDQFLGIPGAGEKMTDEFQEYRPYTSIGQYRAEIGKYIAPEDVAALEQYLFVPVDPNAADAETMQQLPGVTADGAQTLIAARPYADAAAFQTALEGLVGAELATAATTFLTPDTGVTATWLRYNLNTASSEQFLAIPGAGEKMTGEFQEYRPYTSIGQWRAEIGKYIAPEDVAALERYLFVPVDPNAADAATLQQLPGVTPEIAATLSQKRPFADTAAFLATLKALIAPELAATAGPYLVQP